MKAIREVLSGFILGAFLITGMAAACGAPSLVQCRVEALTVLPLDPDEISVGDAKRLAQKLKACEPKGDAGL